MRGKRILQWVMAIVIASIFLFGEGFFVELTKEKTPLTVYAPADMESAFKAALSNSGLSSDYKIVMVEDMNGADVVVDYGKENDETYTNFAFSPFVIAYNTSDSCFKALKKANTVIPSEYNKSFYEIDFLKVIDEVIEEGKWENLGLNDHNQIKLFYPAENTVYWHDFYNFMLLTVNGGIYPKTETEMTRAIEKIERFIKSECTEAVTSFDEKIERTDGFAENTLYVIPEKTVYALSKDHDKSTRLFFPLATVNFNYYVKGMSEAGSNVVNSLNDKAYAKLEYCDYRNKNYYELGDDYSKVYDERDVYQIIEIPKENFFTGNYSIDEEK